MKLSKSKKIKKSELQKFLKKQKSRFSAISGDIKGIETETDQNIQKARKRTKACLTDNDSDWKY